MEADLSNMDEVESLLSFLRDKSGQIAYIHVAPLCGAASRAGGKRLNFLKAHSVRELMPLSDDRFPAGFPWLKGTDKMRTEMARQYSPYAHAAIELNKANLH